jgi:signal transduction histidine kinase
VSERCLTPQGRILYRIILPFTLLFSATTVFSWMISAYFINHHMEDTLKQQMEQVAGVISRSGYVLNPSILGQLKLLIRSEIVLFDHNGEVLISTFPYPSGPHPDRGIIQRALITNRVSFAKDIRYGQSTYRIVLHPVQVSDYGKVVLSIWTPSNEMNLLKETLIWGMGAIACIGMLAMALIGYFIAQTITAPVEELVRVTQSVSDGSFQQRARIRTRDEIGMLAQSFNEMVEKLLSYKQRLVESEKLATAGQMAAGLAHEIRNPLTSIKMLGQVLRGRLKDEPENQQMLFSMVHEIDRLDRIIKELIERTKPGELRLEWEDLGLLVAEVARLTEENLAARDILIEYFLEPGLPKIHMDREKIMQVLWNLILNARDAMPHGGRMVIATRRGEDATVEITVEDSGGGLGADDPESLFRPFYTTKPEGMGLGLAISRKIVERHGGSLILENRSEGGARARVRLPVSHSES